MTKRYDDATLMSVYNLLKENGIWADVYEELSMIAVEIHWGDWKHEHLRAKWIMSQNGYDQLFENTTEEDGSDTYSAVHYFEKRATAEELAEAEAAWATKEALPMC